MTKTQRRAIALIVVAASFLAACASQQYTDTEGAPGFFMGLLHGFVSWFALIGHIFDHNIRIYAYPNTGGWYDFGFLIGLSAVSGGAAGSAR